MRRDSQLVFTTAQAISGAAADVIVLTDQILIPQMKDHTGTATNDRPNVSGKLFWNCIVDGADLLAAVDGCVITFDLYADSDSTPTTGGTVIDSFAVTENTPSEHKDGTYLFSRALPNGTFSPYLGVTATLTVQALSTGKVTSWIGPPLQQGK